jgi:hypothetical protein
MPPWVMKNLHVALIVATNLLALGILYKGLADDVRTNSVHIEELQKQKADETGWMVKQHEKKLIDHDEAIHGISTKMDSQNTKVLEKIEAIGNTVTRIDARTQQTGRTPPN